MKMTAAPIKREFPCKASVRLRDGTRNPVIITAQHLDFLWIQVNSPTRLPGGRILTPGEKACVHRSHICITNR